ncbi:MAG: EAL domain-containing protein [Spirochaetes bacterium]|nr:EAL domain-containing protein [Spirochaetota bacterium]
MAENAYQYIVDQSQDFITLINRDYVYEIVNDSYAAGMGLNKGDLLGKSVADVWGREKFEATIKGYLDRCFAGEQIHYIERFEFGAIEKNMHVSYYPYPPEGSETTHALVFSHDVTRLSEVESKLANFEYRDPLTGLYNRRSLSATLEREIGRARRSSETGKLRGVLFIHLRNFKDINQSMGHQIGDLLLENTGLRVKESVRESDFVFRFEGSNLVVLLTGMSQSLDAAVVAQKIHETVTVPYRYKDQDIVIPCHIGVSIYPQDGGDGELLVQHANSAVIEAQDRGEPFLLYDQSLHDLAVQRMELRTELARAIGQEQLALHFQPIVTLDGEIIGAEALVRWNHPARGMVPPSDFISIAEEAGTISAIDKWALYAVAEQLREWYSRYSVFCSVNLSAAEFNDEYLGDVVRGALDSAGVPPEALRLELTESRCMEDPERAIRRIQEVRDIGVDVWVDDFGTGQSSLSYLKRLPVSIIKIDKMFADDLADGTQEEQYLESIVGSIHARGRQVVIEGVTSAEQLPVLQRIGCSYAQGFYFGRPVPAEELGALLAAGKKLGG